MFAELEAIRLPLKLRGLETVPRTVAAGSFLRAASRVLLERDPASAASRDAGVVAGAGCGGTNAPGQRAVARGHQALRRHQATARTLRRAGRPIRHPRVRPPAAEGACPARTEWSAYSEPFVIAPWYEGGGAPPVQIALPDVTDRNLLRSLKPNVAFELPPALQNLLLGNPKDLLEGKPSGGGSFTVGWICSFSLPIITICAFICLNIFLSLFDLIFRWMFFIKICIPFPKRSES